MTSLNRRDFIKRFGLAGLMTIPVLRQTRSFAADFSPIYCQVFKPLGELPKNGNNMYYPNGDGTNFNFDGKNTESLNAVKDYLIVPRNLEITDGGHGEGQQTVFTNADAGKKGNGSNFEAYAPTKGTSIDHLIADHLFDPNDNSYTGMRHFHFSACPKPELDTSGYTVSYTGGGGYTTPVNDPFEMYKQIVGPIEIGCGKVEATPKSALELRSKSILDFHLEQFADIRRSLDLSNDEKTKLDVYQDQLRTLERQLGDTVFVGSGECPDFPDLNGLVHEYERQEVNEEHLIQKMRVMSDLTVLAMQFERTKVASIMLGHGGDRTQYREITNAGRMHGLSHKTGSPDNFNKISKHMWDEIAYMLGQLKDRQTLDGQSLLDAHCVLIAGGEISRPDNHSDKDFPLMIAGKAGGYFDTGRTFEVPNNDNAHSRVLMSVCNAMGLNLDRLGTVDNGRVNALDL